MVLEKLGTSLRNTLSKIAKAIFVDEKLINELVKEIQRALLQADVNVQLVLNLSEKIKERALKEKPPKNIPQKEHLIKIIYEELVNLLGKEAYEIKITKKKPFKIMMVGLFGSGKCVHPKSLIPLNSGEILSAEELYKRYTHKEKESVDEGEIINIEKENLLIPSFNPKTLKIENKKVTHLWKLKGKELLLICLDNGNDFSVKVTPEHPFFVLRHGELKQIRASMLNEDDFVAIPKSYDTNHSFVSLFNELKELDLSVALDPVQAKRIILSQYSTIKKACKNFKFKRNYCKLTINLKKGIIPIQFLGVLNNNKIRSRNSTNFVSFPEHLTADLAEFLGYLIGDGHLDKKYIEIITNNKEVIKRVHQLSLSLFSIKPILNKDLRTNDTYRIRLVSTTLVQIFSKIFNIRIGKKGKELRAPFQIMKSNNLCLAAFLRAYFDCEAYPNPNNRYIELSSESHNLIKDINLLLLRLDIISTISKKIVSEIPYWRLCIQARYAELYADKIGFSIRSKLNKVKKYKYIGIKQGCGKQDLIPLSNLLKKLRVSLGFSIGEIQNECTSYGRYEGFGMISRESLFKVKELYLKENRGIYHSFLKALNDKINLKSNYSRPVINSFTSFYKREGIIDGELNLTEKGQALLQQTLTDNSSLLDHISSLAESDVCWVRVKEILPFTSKENFVYDLTVEDNHSFIADGIIVHNTTTIGKLAKYFTKRGYKIAALGLDVHRPAAPQQLEQTCEKVKIPCFISKEKDSIKIYKKFEKEFQKFDILIIDTAGRDALSKDLIKEIENLNKLIKPDENILVIPADIGQAAQSQSEQFHKSCKITGVIVTRMDGTAKAGGSLSACSVTKAPIKFLGVGEKVDDLEKFDPERFVSRLLGMGDLKTLLEKAEEAIEKEKAEDLGKKLIKGEFNLIDLYEQMQAMSKMGPLSKIMEMVPGLGKLKLPKDMLQVQESKLKRWKFIMQSMTKGELENPEIISSSRINRIAKGSGCTTKEVRELLKQYKQSKKLMKMMKGKSPEKLMKKFQGKLPL